MIFSMTNFNIFQNAERGHRTSVYVLVVTQEFDEWDDSKTIGNA